MYPPERVFTAAESTIIFRIRQVIGDEPEVFIDDLITGSDCAGVLASGTIYQLQEPKGYPIQIIVNSIEYTSTSDVQVVGYKYLQFTNPVLAGAVHLTVIYNNFKHSDSEILDTYDSSSMTYLTKQCNLTVEELGIDLLILSTCYILLMKDLSVYIESAVDLQDSDSRFDASNRPQYLKDLLADIANELTAAIEAKTACKMVSLPVYKVE